MLSWCLSSYFNIYVFTWLHQVNSCRIFGLHSLFATCGLLVTACGIKPRPPALGAQSLSHWTTREVPQHHLLFLFLFFQRHFLKDTVPVHLEIIHPVSPTLFYSVFIFISCVSPSTLACKFLESWGPAYTVNGYSLMHIEHCLAKVSTQQTLGEWTECGLSQWLSDKESA